MQFATLHPTTARPDLPSITDEEAAALARTTVNLFRAWQLSDIEARTLLGDMAQRTWARWKDGNIGRIDRDLRARMAILMGIHKGLRYLFREPRRGYDWIRKPNAAFQGYSALDVMMRGEITDLIDLRSYLDAERGAW
ncbi:MbcA/ParS/Xre antitoxin family protein [Oceaniglobus ichthyenteri]|uniref:MbcA/ParS/Xre antitoxin family protein n=1 Tax=Oceaniglobus ichthyenteri TaxID=2136177 RepID=UPI000D3B6296|nr:MbcA/ParS/Xre antitoxin family protein [Oceaniglobus ichthyenteri]